MVERKECERLGLRVKRGKTVKIMTPRCTPLQLSHFFSLFLNLDNIGIQNTLTHQLIPTTPDMELVPFSAPKLRG